MAFFFKCGELNENDNLPSFIFKDDPPLFFHSYPKKFSSNGLTNDLCG